MQGEVVLPPAGRTFLDRAARRRGLIRGGGPVVEAFTAGGFECGGHWTALKDYQHVEEQPRMFSLPIGGGVTEARGHLDLPALSA